MPIKVSVLLALAQASDPVRTGIMPIKISKAPLIKRRGVAADADVAHHPNVAWYQLRCCAIDADPLTGGVRQSCHARQFSTIVLGQQHRDDMREWRGKTVYQGHWNGNRGIAVWMMELVESGIR